MASQRIICTHDVEKISQINPVHAAAVKSYQREVLDPASHGGLSIPLAAAEATNPTDHLPPKPKARPDQKRHNPIVSRANVLTRIARAAASRTAFTVRGASTPSVKSK